MTSKPILITLVLASSLTATPAAQAQTAPALKGGEQVYRETCMACHGPGLAGAPRVGDQKTWAQLHREGQAVVTAHGWVGVRGMPPQGGRPALSLEEFARAVAWMARASGAPWAEPDAGLLQRIRTEEAKRRTELKRPAPRTGSN